MSVQVPVGPRLPSPQEMLAWAEFYAFKMRWVIMPIHRWTGEYEPNGTLVCSCQLTGKRWSNCNAAKPGKHPWTGWKQTPMETPEEGFSAWRQIFDKYGSHNGVNIGVRTGPQSNIFAVDLDTGVGKDGVQSVQAWMQTQGLSWNDMATLSAETGGGGTHLIYNYPPGIAKIATLAGSSPVGAGVDVRGDGGYIVVDPSVHASGRVYKWRDAGIDPSYIKQAPQALVSVVTGKARTTPVATDDTYNPSIEELKNLAEELQRKKTERSRTIGKNLADVLNGDKIGEIGTRHDVYRDVVFMIKRRWPTCTAAGIMPFFVESLREWYPDEEAFGAAVGNINATFGFDVEVDQSWKARLAINDLGQPHATDANMVLFFENHPAWQGLFGYNQRTNRPAYLRTPPYEVKQTTFDLSRDKTAMALWFQTKAKMTGKVLTGDVQSAILNAAHKNCYDPLQQQVLALRGTWDGIPRLETVFQRVAGTPDDAWTRTIGPLWFKSLIARILWPGCKCDTMLILEGAQGFRKSTFFSSLMPEKHYFSDSLNRVKHDTETIRLIHSGPAIFEIGELSGLKKQEVEEIKAFLSAFQDELRPLFENYRTTERRCVFVGTTNRDDYLRDETGGRRFWPLKVLRPIDMHIVFAERAQWFAEALHRLETLRERWYLDDDGEHELAAEQQDARYEEDIWFQEIAEYLSEKNRATGKKPENAKTSTDQMAEMVDKMRAGDFVTVSQVAKNALKIEMKNARGPEGARINRILKKLKWLPTREYVDHTRVRGWRRPRVVISTISDI
jgi:predicted P-loop ATPase